MRPALVESQVQPWCALSALDCWVCCSVPSCCAYRRAGSSPLEEDSEIADPLRALAGTGASAIQSGSGDSLSLVWTLPACTELELSSRGILYRQRYVSVVKGKHASTPGNRRCCGTLWNAQVWGIVLCSSAFKDLPSSCWASFILCVHACHGHVRPWARPS